MVGAGEHHARVTAHALGRAGTGKEQIAVTFSVEEDGKTSSITWYGYFTDASYAVTERALQALGWDPAAHDYAFHELNGSEVLVGAEASIVVEEDVNRDGNPVMKVRWVNQPGGGVALKERMSDDEAKTFASTLRKKIIAAKGQAPAPAGRSSAPPAGRGSAKTTRHGGPALAAQSAARRSAAAEEPPPHTDDDNIPF